MKKIIISRTDAIGDVILTLPASGLLKEYYKKEVKIIFLGRSYTEPVIRCCDHIDEFISYDKFEFLSASGKKDFLKKLDADVILHIFPRRDIATASKSAGIPLRIGTSHRWYHWLTCNKLLNLGRKNSPFHEAQLNLMLLHGLGIEKYPVLANIHSYYGFTKTEPLKPEFRALLDQSKFNLIIHPKSNLSAREWSLENYSKLISLLSPDRYKIFVSGSAAEKDLLKNFIASHSQIVTDLTGKMSLTELISFINDADGLLAASTGPLHIAAALGKHALGIYPPIRPVHPDRWAPLGAKAEFLSAERKCSLCKGKPDQCTCMNEVTPEQVAGKINAWRK